MKSGLEEFVRSVNRIQRVDDLGLAGVPRLVALVLLLDEDKHFIRVGVGDVAHGLDFAITETLRRSGRCGSGRYWEAERSAHPRSCRP